MRLKLISPLEKCFLDDNIQQKQEYIKGAALKNENFHFSLCYDLEYECNSYERYVLKINSKLKKYIKVNRVEHVPVQMPVYRKRQDEDYLRKTPGLYPDMLTPLSKNGILFVTNTLQSLFFEVCLDGSVKEGNYPIEIVFENLEGNRCGSVTFNLEIINAELPKQELICTRWFYCDCLKNYYNVKTFSKKHWQIIKNYLEVAANRGVNMILTPIFTPALDTYIGGERPTTQLVSVFLKNGKYSFDFSLLGKWIDLCDEVNIEYFEIAHLFTQWGAKHAPKIIADVDGVRKKIFGWETDSCGKEYKEFLEAFIPELLSFLKSKNGADKRCIFHISDEPNRDHFESYKAAREIVKPLLKGYKIVDALSNYEGYSEGIVEHPIVANDHIKPFIENNVDDLWTYYCCMQGIDVSNSFISMPSYRNRIIGAQMFKYNIKGFLHWGYNFYNNQLSYNEINPLICTDGEYFSPSGDPFIVYPKSDGTALESIRLLVFNEAISDMRAMQLCEKLYSKEYVVSLIEQGIDKIEFDSYPHSASWLLEMRERINGAIKEKVKK